jgi:hypothetical protein
MTKYNLFKEKKIEYQYYKLNQIRDMTYKLGDKIIEDNFKPDYLIGISRGGLCIVRLLSDYLDIKLLIIGASHYEDIGLTKKKVGILQNINKKNIENKKLLVVDDVADTGKSIYKVLKIIDKKEPDEVRTATLHYKPWSKVKPDYYIEETEKWIVYPWEIRETIKKLSKRFPEDKLIDELKRTGIPKKLYQRFL